jgi:hypothetical protein
MDAERFAAAEAALTQTAAAISMRKRGTSRSSTTQALGITDRQVWKVEYVFGLSNNSDDAKEMQNPSAHDASGLTPAWPPIARPYD